MKATENPTELPVIGSEHASGAESRQPSLALVLAVVALGWIVLMAIAPWSIRGTVATAIVAVVLFGCGQTIVRFVAGRTLLEPAGTLLAFPVGLIAACGMAQMSHHLGLSMRPAIVASCILSLPGLVIGGRILWRCARRPVASGYAYILVLLLAAAIHYFPMSHLDSVVSADGEMHWCSVDSAFFESITSLLGREPSPLRNPGLGQQIMPYHYGRLALASAISDVFGLRPGDSLARSTHLLGLLGLMLAALALGRSVARDAHQRPLAGVFAISLIFLLPSFLAWVPDVYFLEGSSFANPLLTKIRAEFSLGTGDKSFYHILNGWSCLWGGIVVLVVAAVLVQPEDDGTPCRATSRWSFGTLPWFPLLIASVGITVNGVAGVGCAAIAMLLPLLHDWKNVRNYAFLIAGGCIFYLFQFAAGLNHSTAPHQDFRNAVLSAARLCGGGLFFLCGFRSLAILCVSASARRVHLVLALALTIFAAFFIVFDFQAYPVYFLSVLAGGLAAGPMAAAFRAFLSRGEPWRGWWMEALRSYRTYFALLGVASGLLLPVACYLFYLWLRRGSALYGPTISLPVTFCVAWLLWYLAGRGERAGWVPSRRFAGSAMAVLVLVACLGAARHTWNMYWPGISVDGGRAASLRHLRDTTGPNSLFATTRHAIDPAADEGADSYVYGAIAERYAFLEGWKFCSAPTCFPKEFQRVQRDNETIFSTRSAAEARSVVERNGITHILLEPGESLGFDLRDAPWLHVEPNPGTLTILKVDRDRAAQSARESLF